MEKQGIMLAVVASMIGAGIAVSFYGSQIITEDLARAEEMLGTGDILKVAMYLDPDTGDEGVFVVQLTEFEEDSVTATLLDPSGYAVITRTLERDSVEEIFEITRAGEYVLMVENSGKETYAIAVVGYVPEESRYFVGITGFYLLIAGLVGIVGVGIYAVRNKKRNQLR